MFNNPTENAIYFVILIFFLFIASVVLYIGDVLLPNEYTIAEGILDQGGYDKTLLETQNWTDYKNNYIEIINWFMVLMVGVLVVSSLFSYNDFESFIMGSIASFIASAIVLYLVNYVFAMIQSVTTGIVVDSISFTLAAYPAWLIGKFHVIIVLNLIASFLGVFLMPKANVTGDQYAG